ncbi:ABC transporter permease [Pseudaeromonas sp. ZJS20]|uniref:ABC transporter permease n=1 Tax=Pseudaeromonas aegiceratis TaxID=3153928 RepID=UPI00390C7F1C
MAASHPLFWRLVSRALWTRRSRMLVMFLALWVGAVIICALGAIYLDIDAKMSRELRTFGANLYVGPQAGRVLDEPSWQALNQALPPASRLAAGGFVYGMARLQQESVMLMGANLESMADLAPYWQIQGERLAVSFDERHAMLGKKLAQRLELKPGDTVTLVKGNQRQDLVIKGIVESGDSTDYYLIVNLALAQRWLDSPHRLSHGLLSLDNQQGQVESIAARLQQQFPALAVRPIRKVSANEGAVLFKIQGLMGLICVVILLLSTLCVNTTLMALIGERAREFALQKALGASRQAILRQILAETLLVAAVAALAGLLGGALLAQLLGQTVFSSNIGLRWPVLPLTLGISLLVAALATVMPVRRALALEPARVLKGE